MSLCLGVFVCVGMGFLSSLQFSITKQWMNWCCSHCQHVLWRKVFIRGRVSSRGWTFDRKRTTFPIDREKWVCVCERERGAWREIVWHGRAHFLFISLMSVDEIIDMINHRKRMPCAGREALCIKNDPTSLVRWPSLRWQGGVWFDFDFIISRNQPWPRNKQTRYTMCSVQYFYDRTTSTHLLDQNRQKSR